MRIGSEFIVGSVSKPGVFDTIWRVLMPVTVGGIVGTPARGLKTIIPISYFATAMAAYHTNLRTREPSS
jgi:hypothetical protein